MSNESLPMRKLRTALSLRLMNIEDFLKSQGLPTLSKLTLIVRDPDNDNAYICVSNEDQAGLEKACALAMKEQDR